MTDKEKLDAIRAEIHRLVDVRGYDREMANDLFTFMDSLPNEPKDKCQGCNNVKGCITCVDGSEMAHIEEPVSNDFEEVSKEPRIWVARNHPNNGALGLYNGKPIRTRYCWEPTGEMRFLERQWFPEVTWENSPKELVVKDKEPVSEDLVECTSEIILDGANFNKSWYAHPELAFKAGAKWQEKKDQDAVEIAREEMIEKAQDWIADTFKYDGSEDFNGGDNDAMSMLLDDFTEYIKGQ